MRLMIDMCFFSVVVIDNSPPSSSPHLIQILQDHFPQVFSTPKGLPPHYGCDHAITLLPNTPINLQPYRYLHI